MAREKEYKHISDSVHGNIYIGKRFVKGIVDTPAFQRLRRIEQTSTRALFPSARHDRFIHSLGVYHIGCLMTEQLKKVIAESKELKEYTNLVDDLSECFEIACLLHDIGHSPFSHTFEKYFGEEKCHKNDGKGDLREELLNELQKHKQKDKTLCVRLQELERKGKDSNFHELTSAIIAIRTFHNQICQCELSKFDNCEFVARMIIGCKYYYGRSKEDEVELQLRNCFIDLLHGGIIDADRLDYACRDVWASGYKTSSVDVERLIAGLYIDKINKKINRKSRVEFVVCFKSNVLNEIESVIDVKDFQVQYVLNHHTIVLEQYLLEQAALKMAEDLSIGKRKHKKPLRDILRWKALTNRGIKISALALNKKPVTIKYMCDDDLIFLMKQSNNEFYQKWSSRDYGYSALWKTRDDFFYTFNMLRKSIDEEFIKLIKYVILDKYPQISEKDILIKDVQYKPRIELDNLYIYMSPGNVTQYKELYRERRLVLYLDGKDAGQVFYYLYISNNALRGVSTNQILKALSEDFAIGINNYKANLILKQYIQ